MSRNKQSIIKKIMEDPTESLRLLDEEDLNLGSIQTVFPNPDPGLGREVRLLDVQCPGRHGEFVTVTFNILPVNNDVNDPANYGGPIVGIVEFGNGSALNRVEIDIPNGNNPLSASAAFFPTSWVGLTGTVPSGGTAISVPGSAVRVYARHDGNGRVFNAIDPISINTDPATGLPFSTRVQAHVSYGIRAVSDNHLYRTMMVSNFAGPVPAATNNYVGVPPFAKSVLFYRPGLQAMTVVLRSRQLHGSIFPFPGTPIAQYHLPIGVNSQVIPLSGLVDILGVINDTDPEPSFAVFSIGL